jgi:uncharacterized protein YecE (DUF72 family)
MADLLLGTSSWTAHGWVGSFYPAHAQPRDFLPIYAQQFRTVEVDSTFYRIPSADMVRGWKEHTPDDFIFAAKVARSITHEKVLVNAENDLANFLKVMDLLGGKLGPLLFQFPYLNKQKFRGLGFFLDRLLPFLAKLPKRYQWVVEVYPSGEPRRRVASAGRPLASWRTEVLRGEDVAAFNPREAFFQGQEFRYFPPLSGVAKIGKIKPPTPGVLKSGKLRFE